MPSPRLLITKHKDVETFARLRVPRISWFSQSFNLRTLYKIPPNSEIYGNLPIPAVAEICAAPQHLRYFHLIIPNISGGGLSLESLLRQGRFQRYHVELMPETRAIETEEPTQ